MSKNENWLLLMHQLPAKPESLRVRVWRSLQKIGALQLKNSVYLLPANRDNEKKFEILLEDILANKGDAFICRSEFVAGIDRAELIQQFNSDRAGRYRTVTHELKRFRKILSANRHSENELMAVEHSLGKFTRQLEEIKEMDAFDCKEQVPTFRLLHAVVAKAESLHSTPHNKVTKENALHFQKKIWVTRSDIHVDRLASAWLIKTYIDKDPVFKFVSDNNYKPKKNEIRFDMFDGEFTHVGDKCTFEVLVEAFAIHERSIKILAEIIHDLDLKDTKFNREETMGIYAKLQGIIKNNSTDDRRLAKVAPFLANLAKTLKA